jgi:hypothetical protein
VRPPAALRASRAVEKIDKAPRVPVGKLAQAIGKETARLEALAARPDPGRVLIIGRSGSGKSFFARSILAGVPRLVVVDPTGEFAAQPDFMECRSVEAVRRAIVATPGRWRLAWTPRGGKEAETLNKLSTLFIEIGDKYKVGDHNLRCWLAVEEMNTSFKLSNGESRVPMFAELCSRGRARGVGLFGITQGAVEVSTRYRRNCSWVVAFSSSSDVDAKRAASFMKRVEWEEIFNLKPHEFISYNAASEEVTRGRNDVPGSRLVQPSNAPARSVT